MNHGMNKVAAHSFAQTLAASLSASLAHNTGSPWQLEIAEGQDPPRGDAQPLPFRITVEGKLKGECFVEFYEPQLSELVARLGEVASNAETAVNPAKALTPPLSEAAAKLQFSLSSQYGDVSLKIDCVSGLACGGMFVVPLRLSADRTSAPSVFLYLDGELLQSLSAAQAKEEQAAQVQGGEVPAVQVPARPEPADASKSHLLPSNLRLVMDVELNVSLRFGQRQLPLREVLELSSGSVIELDRMVDDPVEMLLDGKVVARGEAVIVDGNYGLRVTEIPQSMESHLACG